MKEINKNLIKLIQIPSKNIIVMKKLIKIILKYTLTKIKAKYQLKYSVLNPGTNSDSPSTKSKEFDSLQLKY